MAPNTPSTAANIPTLIKLRLHQQCTTTLCWALLAALITCPLDVAPTVSHKLPTGVPMTSQQSSSRASAANQKAGGVANQLLTNAVPTAEMRPRLQQRPYFDLPAGNVSCIVGQTVTLLCRVRHVGDRTVSWMRKRDLHILTSNIFTYTGDGRFSVLHPESSDDWNLRIEYVQPRDAGIYECQVNTEPKLNLATFLDVEDTTVASGSPLRPGTPAVLTQVGQASIAGAPEVFVKRGSTISLLCTVSTNQRTGAVTWYQGSSLIDFDAPRGGIALETERTDAGTTSKLLVTRAEMADSGNYTCLPAHARPASVYVHVLNGEHPAAMQHGEHASASSKLVAWSITLLSAIGAITDLL
ncbi:fibroblast growth factor receptor-like 1 isoform X2 [Nilaparvata lugens]|uniref:fibroblast growth factor receptor-like 1 isoform X2 n=1 Tax=Nilaparvata lugens TaxID=108931 RepID=UPI00193D5478|nr:fibroblast growth factor receptor-like 1 isoform X2 [Nilaparvata lugens]XP_039291782.1 fibroblast growth factor receptor-like 1 isoform X2 [Nilaparvata lugens]